VLTNKYALTAIGGSMNFYTVFESELTEISVYPPMQQHV
jgi:hypothetical protein